MFRKHSTAAKQPSPPPPRGGNNGENLTPANLNGGSWKVDEELIKISTPLVPSSLSTDERSKFISQLASLLPNSEWVDFDACLHQLGIYLKIFAKTSTLEQYKWVFWTENTLNTRLVKLLLSLDLQNRTIPSYQLRIVEKDRAILAGAEDSKKCVIAIDFGSTHSGFAYGIMSPPQTVHIQEGEGKQPTAALFDKNLKLISYGTEAREWFMRSLAGDMLLNKFTQSGDLNFANEYLYFDGDIKMRLWNSTTSNPDARTCKTLGGTGSSPLLDIVAKVLNYIRNQALDSLNKNSQMIEKIKPEQVLWVLTVPAIWREEDKHFMRRAAKEGGLINEIDSTDLVLALEPECAALAAKFSTEKVNLEPGDKLLTFDCGGGTVDVCAIQVLPDSTPFKFSCKQLLIPSGGDWGGKKIDDEFFNFFENFMGTSILERLSKVNPAALIELMQQWEKMKLSLTLNDFLSPVGKKKHLDVSHVLMEAQEKLSTVCKRFNSTSKYPIQYKSETLLGEPTTIVIPNELILTFFKPTLDSIVEHARRLFRTFPEELSNLKQILLVGGVGQCPWLKVKFEQAFPGISILHSSRSSALVEYGAVKFGMQPGVFRSRRARLTLGMKTTIEYRPNEHRGPLYRENKFFDRDSKQHYIRNVFKPFIVAGEEVELEKVVIHRFSPPNKESEQVKFDIYTCDEHPPVDFITQENCRLLARLMVPVIKGEMEEMEVRLTIGFTEISAEVRRVSTGETIMRRILFEYRPPVIDEGLLEGQEPCDPNTD